MAVKKPKKLVKQSEGKIKKDYLLHLVFFIMGIVCGLLYYRIFLVDYYTY